MLGLMQDWPLLCHRIIDHAANSTANARSSAARSRGRSSRPITPPSAPARSRWRSGWRRTASSWATGWPPWPGTPRGTWRAWYGILGIGAVYHTVNPRLFPEQIVWIVNHAEDRMMIVDLTFVPLLEKIADKLPTIERYVVLTDGAHMPQTTLKNAVAYEDWIGGGRRRFRLARVRREHRRRHVLHLRHHRASQGRALFAPLQRAARLHGGAAGLPRASVRATWCCRWCRCSTPTAGRSPSRRRWSAPRW